MPGEHVEAELVQYRLEGYGRLGRHLSRSASVRSSVSSVRTIRQRLYRIIILAVGRAVRPISSMPITGCDGGVLIC